MSTHTTEDATLIRQRMQQIRLNLPSHFEEIRRDVRRDVQNLSDWKFYVRQYPAVVLPLVALTTFVLVPKKAAPPKQPSSQSLSNMLPWNRQKREQEVATRSWLAGVVSVVAGLALKSATGYVTARVTNALGEMVSHKTSSPTPRNAPSRSPYF